MVESIRTMAVPAITPRADFVVIDEIGRMETAFEGFIPAVHTALSGRTTVIAAIAARGTPALEQIKHRPDVLLFEVTRQNRDSIAEVILKNIEAVPVGENRRALRSAGRKDQTAWKKSTV
jgi:nucleoside-triphosphatase THEP1